MAQIISSLSQTGSPVAPPPVPVAPRPKAWLLGTTGQDASAGFLVLLLCLGISLASGVLLLAGVVAGTVGSGLVNVLSGPATFLTVVAIATLGSWPAVLAVTAVAGVIRIGLGLARAGIIALYCPAAIRGMLAATGVVRVLKQLPHFLQNEIYRADYR